jgi:hypothetical protein
LCKSSHSLRDSDGESNAHYFYSSWLFASSLVLGLGLLGGFGRITEKYCRLSIESLEYFAETDAHAKQYSLIAKSLLNTALEYLDRREAQERLRRTENSSQLFGLIPREVRDPGDAHAVPRPSINRHAASPYSNSTSKDSNYSSKIDHMRPTHLGSSSPRFAFDLDSTFLGLTDTLPRTPDFSIMGGPLDPEADAFAALNLFPLLETSGHIDLANYL